MLASSLKLGNPEICQDPPSCGQDRQDDQTLLIGQAANDGPIKIASGQLARHRRNQEHPTLKRLWPQCAMFPSCQGRQTFVQVFQCHQLQPYLADYLQDFAMCKQ